MRTMTVECFQFVELSDKAKENARNWYRGLDTWGDWFECIYDDAKMVGIEITEFHTYKNFIKGKFTDDACFTAHKVIKDHGETCKSYYLATQFLSERDELVDCWPKDSDGEMTESYELDNKLDSLENAFLKDILGYYLDMLKKEYEYRESDEFVDESIIANEYEFLSNGKRI